MITKLFPAWSKNLGLMAAHGVHVRSRCQTCHVEQSVDLKAVVPAMGAGASLIDRSDPCVVSGCNGKVSYRATLPFRGHWIALTSSPDSIGEQERPAARRTKSVCVVSPDDTLPRLSFADEA